MTPDISSNPGGEKWLGKGGRGRLTGKDKTSYRGKKIPPRERQITKVEKKSQKEKKSSRRKMS